MTLTASEARPMWLDMNTDIMGAAVVPLSSVEVRVLDPGEHMSQADDVQRVGISAPGTPTQRTSSPAEHVRPGEALVSTANATYSTEYVTQ
jgi:hypothetical protein